MNLIPNPEYAEAELELGYIQACKTKRVFSFPCPLRFREKDADVVWRALRDSDFDKLKSIAVPSHIPEK